MDILIWLIIVSFFLLSFVGLFYPVIPGILMIWLGFASYHFFMDSLGFWSWGSLLVLTVLIFAADFVANMYFVERRGGSKWGGRMAIAGLIIGAFVVPPFGIILVPFALVVITEYLVTKDITSALKIGTGTVFAFLSSTFAKFVIQVVIIVIFFLDVWLM
ncbi:DUF456 domain-containing protein [Bacillus sp. H-16]|uniref:DUF456 domain-containing protein n=1 Tax=Alteribacter salitolerans TaxID=2912333 RepID=UPI00196328A7|nr:DUF456 domain-containing protein [Alteribacter salitolerans]MBM7094857.1 DUF456 domain-containing protein [Alteribacter salitolerans]